MTKAKEPPKTPPSTEERCQGMKVIGSRGCFQPTADLLRNLKNCGAPITIEVDGELSFTGSYQELFDMGLGLTGLLGEDPIERSLSDLFGAECDSVGIDLRRDGERSDRVRS